VPPQGGRPLEAARGAAPGSPAETTAPEQQLTRLFIEALNARDVDGLAAISDDGIELRHPGPGRTLRGKDGLERLVVAAADADVLLVRVGEPEVTSENGVTRVKQPVRESVGGAHTRGTALFEVRAEKIAAFEIESEWLRS
jgi:hypothetical protein